MNLSSVFAVSTLPLLLAASPVQGRVWRVASDGSGDAPTIAAAVDSATGGDEILIGPGTYREYLVLKPGIAVRGDGPPESVILDRSPSWAPGFVCPEPGVYPVERMTIRNAGPGIMAAADARPLISLCTFEDCESDFGGAIACSGGSIVDCTFRNNQAEWAGAIACDSATVRGCTFENNVANRGSHPAGMGGAVYWQKTALVSDCVFRSNTASVWGGAIVVQEAATIFRCLFVDNVASEGAAIWMGGWGCSMSECEFVGNDTGGTQSGAVDGPFLTNCTIEHCTFVGTPVPVATPQGTMRNCIVAWARSPLGRNLQASCIDIWPPLSTGTHAAFYLDPQFCAVDPAVSLSFTLQSDSPCLPENLPPGFEGCGLIGASEVGCGIVPTNGTTWTQMKRAYR